MKLPILAALLTVVFPVFVGAGVLFGALRGWIDRTLRSDPGVHERLQLDTAEGRVAWTVVSDQGVVRWPYPPLAYAALAALAVTGFETAVFVSRSSVPFLWYISGTIASVVVLLTPFAAVGLLPNPFRRLIDRMLRQHANDKFAFAAQTLFEVRQVARQIDESYASMGLPTRTNVLQLCRQALLERAWLGQDSALAELIGIKIRSEYDLRCLQYLEHQFASARTALEQAKVGLHGIKDLQESIERVDNQIYSRELADALEGARWPDARALFEKIGSDLGRLLEIVARDCEMPESLEDAYRTLNVSDETPLEHIKAVVNAYRRVWHPDFAHDDIERQRCTLRMQQINVAWAVLQKARAKIAEAKQATKGSQRRAAKSLT